MTKRFATITVAAVALCSAALSASPVAADHKVFFVSEAGIVSVVKAAGDWEILKVNKLNDECYATPAIVDNKLYIRTRNALYCFGNQK